MISSTDAVADSAGAFVIGAHGAGPKLGGLAPPHQNRALTACLDRSIGRLTGSGRMGYEQWGFHPAVLLRRAEDAKSHAGG